jgi:hypothetical protein
MCSASAVARFARRCCGLLLLAGIALPAQGAFVAFSVGGSDAASITATVDNFRAALGAHQEINWDAGGTTSTTFNGTPLTTFTDSRGSTFTTPGTGFVQATPEGLDTFFSNPTYSTTFNEFSPLRVFTASGNNLMDVTFSLPGSNGTTPATVSGFGAVFSDVDLANVTRLDLFSSENDLLFSSFVEPGTIAQGSLSFLGLLATGGEQIGRVRISLGTAALGPAINDGGLVDLVVMDNVLYSQPVAPSQSVPEPATFALILLALLAGVRAPILRSRRRASV